MGRVFPNISRVATIIFLENSVYKVSTLRPLIFKETMQNPFGEKRQLVHI